MPLPPMAAEESDVTSLTAGKDLTNLAPNLESPTSPTRGPLALVFDEQGQREPQLFPALHPSGLTLLLAAFLHPQTSLCREAFPEPSRHPSGTGNAPVQFGMELGLDAGVGG